MITSVSEFVQLRQDPSPAAKERLRWDEASAETWLAILSADPDAIHCVELNKRLPEPVLRELLRVGDSATRYLIAEKRQLSPGLLEELSQDYDESVRLAVAYNPRTPMHTLRRMQLDTWSVVRDAANRRLADMAGKDRDETAP